MAPSSRKRSRRDEDNDDEQEHNTEQASSSFRQSAKRSRVAMAQERGGSTVSDDESDADLEQFTNGYGADEDMEEAREDEDEEINETSASQFVQKGIRNQRENVASESGVIEEVR